MGDTKQFNEDRRRHDRQPAPRLMVRIGGHWYPAVEWSFGGFLVEDMAGQLFGGALINITGLALGDPEGSEDHAGNMRPVEIRARVVRTQRDSGLAALTSYNLDANAYRVMAEVRESADRAVAAAR